MHDEYYQKYKKTIVIDIDDTISFANTFDDVNTYSKAVPNINLIKTMQNCIKKDILLFCTQHVAGFLAIRIQKQQKRNIESRLKHG